MLMRLLLLALIVAAIWWGMDFVWDASRIWVRTTFAWMFP